MIYNSSILNGELEAKYMNAAININITLLVMGVESIYYKLIINNLRFTEI